MNKLVHFSTALASVFLTTVIGLDTAAAQFTAGTEWVVNGTPNNAQEYPAIDSIPCGGYIVVWESQDQDGSGEGVYGRILDVMGFPSGAEFRVNTTTAGSQDQPAVASLPSGEFIVAWEASNGLDGSGDGVFAQRFSSAGIKLGLEFQVNTHTPQSQSSVDIAADGSGNFVIVWQSAAQDGNNNGIFGQRFDASATPLGTEFQVNTTTLGSQADPAVSMDDAGNFVVVFTNTTNDVGLPADQQTRADVYGQRYASSGARASSEFLVNTYTTQNQDEPDVSMASDGSFVVTWESGASLTLETDSPPIFGQDGSTNGVFAQRFNSSGSPQGGEFQVNTYTTASQDDPHVSQLAGGGFVIAWESGGTLNGSIITQDGDELGVFAQRYDASGAASGTEFLVNQRVSDDQTDPVIGADAEGNFVIAWESFDQDGSYGAIVARQWATSSPEPVVCEVTCDVTPAIGCISGAPGRSVIGLTKKGGSRDKLKWSLKRGGATALADFLDPANDAATEYTFCLYDASGKFLESTIPAMGFCDGKPCWRATGSTGFSYKSKLAQAGGIQGMKMKAGEEGRASVQIKGKGSLLGLQIGTYAVPVTAQLIADNGSTSQCWQTVFSTLSRNTLSATSGKGP